MSHVTGTRATRLTVDSYEVVSERRTKQMSVTVSEFNCLQFKLDKSHCNAMLEKMVPRRAFLSDPIRSVGRQPVTNLVLNDVKIFIINHYQRCV